MSQMLGMLYVALPGGPLSSLFRWWPQGPKKAHWQGLQSLDHRNAKKKIKKSFGMKHCLVDLNQMVAARIRCMKFGLYHGLIVLNQVCSNGVPRVQNGPGAGSPRLGPVNYIEIIQNSSSSKLQGSDAWNSVCSIA